MLDLLKIVELLQGLENVDKGCISKSNRVYVALEKLTSEISNMDESVFIGNEQLERLHKEVTKDLNGLKLELEKIYPYLFLSDAEKTDLAAKIFLDFDRLGNNLTESEYMKYLNGETKSTKVDKRSMEDIEVIYGSFDKAMEYYCVFRVRNNLDNRF
jgi:hypothetical protein